MRHSISLTLAIVLSASGVSVPTWAGEFIRAKGDFTVEIDFSTLSLKPVDENCLLTVVLVYKWINRFLLESTA